MVCYLSILGGVYGIRVLAVVLVVFCQDGIAWSVGSLLDISLGGSYPEK